jgi:hypothetical protein
MKILVDKKSKHLVIPANGKPKFIVSKSRKPKMTRKLAETWAIGKANGSKFDGAAFLLSLKNEVLC